MRRVAGFAAVGAGFGYVHGVTLAFGVTMIGEAVDYAVYLFVQADGGSDPNRSARWTEQLWPTVRLGMATSIAGFSVLLLSGFPGLAQLGLFAIVGLIGAALATRYGLPLLVPKGFRLRDLSAVGARLETGMHAVMRWRRWMWLPCLAAAALIVWQSGQLWQRELTALSPVSPAARELDATLRADLGAPDVRYVIAVPANDREAALRGAETTAARLAALVQQGVLAHVDTPTRLLPSEATQRQRQAALPPAAELQSRLAAALHGLPMRADKLSGFVEDVERARQAPFLSAESLAGTSLALAVQSLLVEREAPAANEPGWLALLPLHGIAAAPIDVAAVRAALSAVEVSGHAPLLLDMKAAEPHDVRRLPARGCVAVRRRGARDRVAAGHEPA